MLQVITSRDVRTVRGGPGIEGRAGVLYQVDSDGTLYVWDATEGVMRATGQGSVSGAGNIRDFIDLQQASADLFNADKVVPLTVAADAGITLESPLLVNHGTLDLDLNGTTIEAGNITGNYKAITARNSFVDYSGYRKYDFARPFLRNGTIKGPGPSANFASLIRQGKGTAGLYFNGVRGTPNKVVRPVTESLLITGFDTGIDGKTGFFLANFSRTHVYDCALGFRQRRGLDAGERIVFSNRCLMQRVRLAFLLEDDSSELHYDGSLDYLMQWLLADPVTGLNRPGHLGGRLV